MSKQSFSFMESIIAIGALVTSSAAVYIAWDQAGVMHSEQHLSVMPAIQIDRFELDEGASVTVGFNIENAGVGPAFLKSATLSKKGEPIEGQEHLASEVPLGVVPTFSQMSGRVLAPGVMKQALTMQWRADALEPGQKSEIYTKTDGLALEICYCSTLNRCWVSKSNTREHPKQLPGACPAPKKGGLF